MRRAALALPPLALAALAVFLAWPSPRPAEAGASASPVVLELFTSEGCSSCPAANAVLDHLAAAQPVPGAEVIALELHVDYWNYLGWADPWSQAAFTARQTEYNRAFGKRGVYTPQLVVDGRRELVGSRGRDAEEAVAEAAKAPHARVRLARRGDAIDAVIEGAPEGEALDVMLAVTEARLASRPARGENAGVSISHAPVVRDLRRVSSIAAGARGPIQLKDIQVRVDPSWRRENLRAVVFVQAERSSAIAGAGAIAVP